MVELLIELFSEEIPARMQKRAIQDFEKMMTSGLVEAGLTYGAVKGFVTPRRMVLMIDELPLSSMASREERKGPKVNAPEQAIEGFLRSTGLGKDALEIRDVKGMETYFAVFAKAGRPAEEIVGEVLEHVIRNFPWPKSMRWGAGSLRWVRPLHSIIAMITEGEESRVVPLEIEGIQSGNFTFGHRFMAPKKIEIKNNAQYLDAMAQAKVVLDQDARIEKIKHDATNAAFAAGLELVENPKLLAENAGLTEYPVVYIGEIDEAFRALPAEVIETSMAEHQKFLSLRDPESNQITGYVIVANRETADHGATIKAGNAKVLNARLSDAKFFWENDLRLAKSAGMECWTKRLENVTFHNKLGAQAARVERIASLAQALAPMVGATAGDAAQAARIAKADLQSEMVFEFPELQGLMGRYYAEAAGYKPEIAAACEEHYSPLGPSDDVPSAPISVAVALADKIDLLTSFWAIDEKPTGSKDPFALRRAALGVIRLVLENDLRMSMREELAQGYEGADIADLMAFIHDRLKVYLRDQGIRHDVIDATIELKGADDLSLLVKRARALNDLIQTEDGTNLQAGIKRALNILAAEEEKDGVSYELAPEAGLMKEEAELALQQALNAGEASILCALKEEEFTKAMTEIGALRPAIDGFFDNVTVNDDSPMIRRNRLCLLNRVRALAADIADFQKLEG